MRRASTLVPRAGVVAVAAALVLALAASAAAQEEPITLVPGEVMPPEVVAGEAAIQTIRISRPAPPGGVGVSLYGPPLYRSWVCCGSVTVPEGQTSVSFPIRLPTNRESGFEYVLHAQVSGQQLAEAARATVVGPDPAVRRITALEGPPAVLSGALVSPRVVLSSPAPAGGLVLTLTRHSASGGFVIISPGSYFVVQSGATSASATLRAPTVTVPRVLRTTTHMVSSDGEWVTAIVPESFALGGTFVRRGESNTAGVGIGTAPNPSGQTVRLASDTPGVTVPQTVTIPAGSPGTTYEVAVDASVTASSAQLTATWNGQTATANVSITGPLPPGDPDPDPDPDPGPDPGPGPEVTELEAELFGERMVRASFAAEGAAGFECRLGTAPFAPCASGVEFGPLSEGPHAIGVRALDGAGAAGPVAERTVTVVETAITGGPPALSNDRDPLFAFTSGAGTAFECALDGLAFAPCNGSGTHRLTGLSDGAHVFRVRAVAGEWSDPTPATWVWTVDTAPPETTLTSATPTTTGPRGATFAFSASEPATFECSLSGPSEAHGFAPCASPTTYSKLKHGTYTFQVRARDAAGNVDPTPARFTWSTR